MILKDLLGLSGASLQDSLEEYLLIRATITHGTRRAWHAQLQIISLLSKLVKALFCQQNLHATIVRGHFQAAFAEIPPLALADSREFN